MSFYSTGTGFQWKEWGSSDDVQGRFVHETVCVDHGNEPICYSEKK